MIEADILTALQKAAIAAINASIVMPGLPIRALGKTAPTGVTKWFEFSHIPNNPTNEFWNEERNYQGNFRIILHWDLNEEGIYKPVRLIDEIAAAFPKSRQLIYGVATVQIYDVPAMSSPIENAPDLLFPLALPYRTFRAA